MKPLSALRLRILRNVSKLSLRGEFQFHTRKRPGGIGYGTIHVTIAAGADGGADRKGRSLSKAA